MVNARETSPISRAIKETSPAWKRRPVSVYRINFNSSFTFRDAAKLVPYLHELGVSDCYTSPYLKARAGSQHGYDITDHGELNPEIGTRADYDRFVSRLQKHGMGQIMDFVPNHMSIFDNPRWQDVLENGPSSPYARFFDIDWEPARAELRNKVLLPILEDLYGNVLQSGYIRLGFDKGAFLIGYQDHRLPVGPRTASVVLEACLGPLGSVLGAGHPDFLELQSLITACKNLPERSHVEPEKVSERQREKEIIKKRLWELYTRNSKVKKVLHNKITSFNGAAGDNASFARLHELLEKQAYRLSYWRVAADEINYRRFFDVNDLVAIRMEDPLVFEEAHRLILDLLVRGAVAGIRIDHVDGLFNPEDYLWRLQKAHWLKSAILQLESVPRFGQLPESVLRDRLSHAFDRESERHPESSHVRPLYIVVEKILSENERLKDAWPVDGTTGYEFMTALNGLFVDVRNKRSLLRTYRQFTGNHLSFEDISYQSKNLVMRTSMAAELNLVAHQLDRVSERSWQYRDFTLNSLRDATREVIASFPVYRTYINAYGQTVDEKDRHTIETAINRARRRNPAVGSAILDFLKDILLLRFAADMTEEGRNEQRLFVMRFQQFTSPVMAKGVEDTAFYIHNPLVSLNEVGGGPQKFGSSPEEFHRQNKQRHRDKPHSFMTTSTHDSKRSEDVRARINVLSEMPREWRAALRRWSRINQDKKTLLNNESVPDSNEEYLIYQTLLGTYPVSQEEIARSEDYRTRIQQYMLKAVREAKAHTSWINPNAAYEESISGFIGGILDPALSSAFLADFEAFLKPVATCGIYNSLSQAALKFFSPGVPEIYQGNELWSLCLTDPDNRRPVDFDLRMQLLRQIKQQAGISKDLAGFARSLMDTKQDGRIKLYVTWKSLNYRRENAGLFITGNYLPLKITGEKRDHVCAFAWKKGDLSFIVAAPRLTARLTRFASTEPVGRAVWGDTCLALPKKFGETHYRNIFTGESLIPAERAGRMELRLADTLATFPVAALESAQAE